MKAFRLRELMAKAGRSEKYNGFAVSELRTYLFDNAEAIAELIEAAEMVSHTTTDSKASGYLAEALAKIKE